MNINIFGEHIEVTPSIKEYIKKKFLHLHIPDKLTTAEFRIGATKTEQYIHFHSKTPGEELIIKANDKNLYHAIDNLMKKIHIAFVREKDKKHHHLQS